MRMPNLSGIVYEEMSNRRATAGALVQSGTVKGQFVRTARCLEKLSMVPFVESISITKSWDPSSRESRRFVHVAGEASVASTGF
jgi:hypothetical protein